MFALFLVVLFLCLKFNSENAYPHVMNSHTQDSSFMPGIYSGKYVWVRNTTPQAVCIAVWFKRFHYAKVTMLLDTKILRYRLTFTLINLPMPSFEIKSSGLKTVSKLKHTLGKHVFRLPENISLGRLNGGMIIH